jgi:hypothetical protein
MPWARIPADKLINLPLFGIDIIADDGDYVWMRGPSGRMRVNKKLPRIFFESAADAHQAGAVSIRIGNQREMEDLLAFEEHLAADEAEAETTNENIGCDPE